MAKHINCYFFRSADKEAFWVQYKRHKNSDIPADWVRYSDCHFTVRNGGEIAKVVDYVHGVTYIPSPDCPYFQG